MHPNLGLARAARYYGKIILTSQELIEFYWKKYGCSLGHLYKGFIENMATSSVELFCCIFDLLMGETETASFA